MLKFLASLKLAVTVIVLLALLTAIGTFVEARYDATAAAKLVYKTWWMYSVMVLLAVNLIAVMVDRWPWKRRHTPFLLAHVGIIVLLIGSVVTSEYGIDGSLRVGIGESNRYLALPNTDIVLWSSFDGERYSKLSEQEVDFFKCGPEKCPVELPLLQGSIKVLEYQPYTLPSKKITPSDNPKHGAGLRFLLNNQRVNMSEWLLQPRPGQWGKLQLGPANIFFGEGDLNPTGENEIWISPSKTADTLRYTIFYKDQTRKSVTGTMKVSESIPTGWMDLSLKAIAFYPHAEESWEFKHIDRPTELSTSAIKIDFMGKPYWVQLNDVVKLYSDNAVYVFSYAMRKFDIGFNLQLQNFNMQKYQGTDRAATYESLVAVAGHGEHLISMNEPLKHNGLTIYQASFQQDPNTGEPIASIFSINYDPGRWIKYLGSLIISLGIIALFYYRRKAARAMAPKQASEVLQ